VAEPLGKAVLELVTDDSKLTAGLAQGEAKVRTFGSKISGITKAIGGAATGLAVSSLVGGLSDAANAAAADEAGVISLQQAVENSGATYDDYAVKIDAAVKNGQRLAYSDDQTRAALQMLTEETGSTDEALKRLPATMDLARAKHIDLVAAAKLLGKVSDENTKGLKRLGIVMEDGATAADVLAKVQQVAGGQAEAYGASTAGSIFKVKDSIDEWRESIGYATGPAMGLIALLPGLSSGVQIAGLAFGGATGLVKDHVGALKGLGTTLATGGAVLIAIVAVGIAIYEVGETVRLVAENWEKFKYALTTGRLSDIPVFGFFFGKIQMMLGLIQGAIDLWGNLTKLFGGGPPSPEGQHVVDQYGPNGDLGAVGYGQYAKGADMIVRRPHLFLAGEAGPERVTVSPLGGAGGNMAAGPITVNQTLNYTGDSAAMAQDAAGHVIDALTEAYQQQARRLAGSGVGA
jgi:hypothetical protein